MVIILMMPSKMATQGFPKITIFLNKGCDVIIPVHGVISNVYHVFPVIL